MMCSKGGVDGALASDNGMLCMTMMLWSNIHDALSGGVDSTLASDNEMLCMTKVLLSNAWSSGLTRSDFSKRWLQLHFQRRTTRS